MRRELRFIFICLSILLLIPIFQPTLISANDTTKDNVPINNEENDDGFDLTSFRNQVNVLLNEKNFSGTILVMRHGKLIYESSRGYSNYANRRFNTEHTSYEIDSIQKSFTAAMIMKQVELGKLSLNDKLYKFYPSIPGSKKITIRQMLDMKSGLLMPTQVGPSQVMSDDNILKNDISKLHFSNAYYNKWFYSPINYNLLSGILEQVTGKSYRYMFTKTYIDKLHLKHTIFAYDRSSQIDMAAGYSNIDPLSAKSDYRNAFRTNKYYTYDELGTGQVYMSAEDLYKAEYYIVAGKMLTKKSQKQLHKSGSHSLYGGGFYNDTNNKFANGWGYGFQGVIHISDNGKNAVVALENYQRISVDIKPVVVQIYNMLNN